MLQDLLKTSLFILSLVLVTSLLGSSSVNAQSQFDDVITLTDNVGINIYQGSEIVEKLDLTTSWFNLLTHSEHIPTSVLPYADNYTGHVCQFDPQTATSWILRQDNRGAYTLVYSNDVNPDPLKFIMWSGTPVLQAPEGHFTCGVNYISGGTIYTNGGYRSTPTDISYGTPQKDRFSVAFANWDIEYPTGYEGEIPPDSLLPPEEPEKIGVSIRGSVAEDIVQVEWYHDPTNPKPDEAQGMYLVLHNINFDEIPPECSNQDIQEWRHSLDEIAIFNPVPCYGMWYVQSYYTSDPQGQNIIPNTDKTNLNLRIDGGSFYFDYSEVEYDEDGSIISPPISGVNMANCVVFTEGLPYVEFNYQGCFSNIQKFIGIASTNNANVSRQFENIAIPAHQGCGSFTKFNNFLHISDENNWLCPQLTDELRQPITLFAVFILYIVAMFGWFYLMSGRV